MYGLQKSYFSTWLVLIIDLVISAGASLLLFFLNDVVQPNEVPMYPYGLMWTGVALGASAVMFLSLGTHKAVIRYATLRELGRLTMAILGKTFIMAILLACFLYFDETGMSYWILLFDFLACFGALIIFRISIIALYDFLRKHFSEKYHTQRILIYGNGEKSVAQAMRLRSSSHYRVLGFVVFGEDRNLPRLSGYRIFWFRDERDVAMLINRLELDGILFPYYEDARAEENRLIKYCGHLKLQTLISPSIDKITDGQIPKTIRKINIEDLLGRDEINISMTEIRENFSGKTVLVTGAAGSIGSELCRQLAKLNVGKLIMFDNAETPLHNLKLEFEDHHPDCAFMPVIGDVRFPDRLDYVFRTYHPQIVFHAAAYKHVPLMEENPCEGVLVNVMGSRNVADKCIEYEVEKMVMISTDKAVNPTNIMGLTKRLAEIYVQSLGLAVASGSAKGKTRFITTRFGNVLGSNGSVIPRFKEQILAGGPVTVTHPEINRFFMTIPEACRLVMEAATISKGNEICVFDMGESVKIVDMARRMIELSGYEPDKDIKIEFTGLRPGEKLYEEVLANDENTLPTSHDRIRIARVREYTYKIVHEEIDEVIALARAVNISPMLSIMKAMVPEYHQERH